MKEVYIVCDGDVEAHSNLAVFREFRNAEAYATERARKNSYVRDEGCAEEPEIAFWVRIGTFSGRLHGYVSIEKWVVG